jgi:hypothetical protein
MLEEEKEGCCYCCCRLDSSLAHPAALISLSAQKLKIRGAWSCFFFFRVLLGKEKCKLQRALPDRIVSDSRRMPIVDLTMKNPTLGVSVTDDEDDELFLRKSWPPPFRRSVSITSDEVVRHCCCR